MFTIQEIIVAVIIGFLIAAAIFDGPHERRVAAVSVTKEVK